MAEGGDTIDVLVAGGESDRLELKKSLAELDNTLRTIAAFSSQTGGTVVFGVGPSGSVVGLQVGANTLENLVQAVRTRVDPKIAPHIRTAELAGRTVITVEVEGTGRPHLADGRFYKRVGNATVQATTDEYRDALRTEVQREPQSPIEAARTALARAADASVPASRLALEALSIARRLNHPAAQWLKFEVVGYPQRDDGHPPSEEELPHYRQLQVYASNLFPERLAMWASLAG